MEPRARVELATCRLRNLTDVPRRVCFQSIQFGRNPALPALVGRGTCNVNCNESCPVTQLIGHTAQISLSCRSNRGRTIAPESIGGGSAPACDGLNTPCGRPRESSCMRQSLDSRNLHWLRFSGFLSARLKTTAVRHHFFFSLLRRLSSPSATLSA